MADVKTELLFEMSADLEEPQDVGATPHGNRQIIYIKGGTFEGPKLKGEVLPGGGDWALIRPDGAVELDVRIALRTDDDHLIYMYYRGIRYAPPEVMQRIRQGEVVHPSEYYFRTVPFFETASEKYGWLNRIVGGGHPQADAEGGRRLHGVRYPLDPPGAYPDCRVDRSDG